MPALDTVLDAIARAALGDTGDRDEDAVTVGTVTLRAHQLDALRRVRASVERVGGALLADEPGLGKTFVALALAREHPHRIVVAPAALRAMWRGAAAAAGIELRFVSVESLSRHDVRPGPELTPGATARDGLVIVDEAHHVSNRATARYVRLARLASYRRVLLLTATPVRNRRAELAVLLALFMGPRAHALGDAELARCIVRRRGDASLLPAIDGPHWHAVRGAPRLRGMLAALPPPLPALDGRDAAALLGITLARCWASSLAALDAALKRRLLRGAALAAILDEGRLPTRSELRTWVVGDDAVQFAFPSFVEHRTPHAARLRPVLDAHLDAVRALRRRIRARVERDAASRAKLLLELRRAHVGARLVAFTAHAATAEALYRALRGEPGVALLTAHGARTAGGLRPRADVIGALSAAGPCGPAGGPAGPGVGWTTRRCAQRDDLSLVIATDLLSEGVNLQASSVIVHLDVPWTPAGLDQRVGRAVRMGSPHAAVHVHGIAPPAAAERLLALGLRLAGKRLAQADATRAPRELEQLRAIVRAWRSREGPQACAPVVAPEVAHVVAHAAAARTGFIAVVEMRGDTLLVCGLRRGSGRWRVSDAPGALCALARAAAASGPRASDPDPQAESSARAALEGWIARRHAGESTGTTSTPSRARRRLLARLDVAMRLAGAHARAAFAVRVANVRALVDGAISAGAEHDLDVLARSADPGLEALVRACEVGLAPVAARATPGEGTAGGARRRSGAPRALLLLRPDP